VENARVALRVCELLARQTGRPGAAAVVAGLEQARWPGRLEKLAAHPPVWADGAHNPLAARALRDFIAAMGWRPVLIYGSLRDKAIGEISELLFPLARHVILTRPESPRALSPSALAMQAAPAPVPVEPSENLAAALARARELAGATTPILITGSLYLVGEAQALLEPKQVARGCE
jgi:dihydrofolate synthase/folylpolyglutamate synthase